LKEPVRKSDMQVRSKNRRPTRPAAHAQPGILAQVPLQAGYLFLSRETGIKAELSQKVLMRLIRSLNIQPDPEKARLGSASPHVLGLSAVFVQTLGGQIAGHRPFPTIDHAKVDLPVTQSDIVVWLRGSDQGELFHTMRQLCACTQGVFKVDDFVAAFKHREGRDLSGFEDGTENPKGKLASHSALQDDGSSFLALQLWEHEFGRFEAMSEKARNHAVGRDLRTNQELEAAPATAHVKRTAQESFAPEAFVLRRSMPWIKGQKAGLMFAAFGRSFDAFEAQLRRMSGAEDGKIDGLFNFTRPMGGGYYWCPPLDADGAFCLSHLGLPEAELNPLKRHPAGAKA
jgi:porphyrinogen peroxidase